AALTTPGLLLDQGGNAWLLRANMVVKDTARLEATSVSIARLRLDSAASFVTIYAEGGHVLIQNIAVTSWNTAAGTIDTNYADGRAYMVAHDGGRMDIIGSEVAYLGWADGEPSGVSWHGRATAARPETGATGSITGSNIHHNYFGLYSYEAYGLVAKNSQFHDNIVYGFDPHDRSTKFEVAFNKVYNNGKHGIIFSRGCQDNSIHDNQVYNNVEHGIMLDRGSNNNRIANNLVYGNADGLAIFQSSNNLIENNTLRENERGARINATYDATDIFDSISTGNTLRNNTIADNSQYGVYLYERADRNTLEANQISGNTSAGVYLKTGGNQVLRNTIVGNGTGVSIVGGSLSPFPPGGPTPTPALEQPGRNNQIIGNTIEDNDASGIQIKTGVNTTIGGLQPGAGNQIKTNGTYGITLNTATTDTQIAGNTIQANGVDGVLLKGADSVRNQITRNSISANAGQGIKLSEGANGGIAAPAVTSAPNATTITGTAPANATIEVYRDINGQGRVYKGQTMAAANGNWSFALPSGDDPAQGGITALAIAANGNT
ncbi:MAG TPA: right-handed parallel beta-helix repeat-containing protein, partial [Roseiflexaceae bacterium]|nr:right-handed parallel beta-helix repeat-containing protein [Roseiflexaceae bacterium]